LSDESPSPQPRLLSAPKSSNDMIELRLLEQRRYFSIYSAAGSSSVARRFQSRSRTYMRATSMLLLISTTFLVLNTPLVISKLRYLYVNWSGENSDSSNHHLYMSSIGEQILERLSCHLFYLNFAIDFLLYAFNRATWRKFLLRKVCCCCCCCRCSAEDAVNHGKSATNTHPSSF
jgi:hypothetical protein